MIVAESIDCDDSSGSKANVALIDSLRRCGYELQVYHYTRKNISLEGIKCVAIKENRKSFLFYLSRFERQLRYKLDIDIHSFLEEVFGFSFTLLNDRNSIAVAVKKALKWKPDLVVTLSKGSSFRPHHALLRIEELHSKWMAYIHDPYPMHSYPRPYDWVEPGHKKKRDFFSQLAGKTKFAAYPSLLLANWMESYYPNIRGKAVIIPHQINRQIQVEDLLPDFFHQSSFTILHAGALMDARNPMPLVAAFRKFLRIVPEAHNNSQLLFIGEKSKFSEKFAQIKKDVPQLYSSDAYLPYSTVAQLQKCSTVNVILEAKGPISPFLPGKFPHCIEASKPILLLGPYYSESKRLLGEEYPWWSEIEDEERILQHLIDLYHAWKENSSLIKPDYSFLNEYLSDVYLKNKINDCLP